MSRVIAVDFDDVIFDCNGTLCQFHNERYGTNYTVSDIDSWDLANLWGVSAEEEDRRIREYVTTDFHAGAPLIEGARAGLTELKKLGYKVIFVTSRGESIQPQTEAWMKKNIEGLYDSVYYTNHFDKEHPNRVTKADACHEIGAGVLIEDAIHHAENVAGSNIPVLLMDQPWNQTELGPNVVRIKGWPEALAWISKNLTL